MCEDKPWGYRALVHFTVGGRLSDYNTISLDSLGVQVNDIPDVIRGVYPNDALGNQIHIGDKVLYLHRLEMYVEIGTVKKLTEKTCLLAIDSNRFNQIEYRKRYEEIISLSAINKDQLIIDKNRGWV
jgi:hypothetical protein